MMQFSWVFHFFNFCVKIVVKECSELGVRGMCLNAKQSRQVKSVLECEYEIAQMRIRVLQNQHNKILSFLIFVVVFFPSICESS